MITFSSADLQLGATPILQSASQTLPTSAHIGVVGRNGAGKSTLLQVIAGEQPLDAGSCTTTLADIAYLPQNVTLTSTRSVIDEALRLHDRESINAGADEAHMKKLLVHLGFSQQSFDMYVSQLSTGWKMRVVLAQLLARSADFYLFDEPTNHLDIVAREWFLSYLNQAPFGFMLVSHQRSFLEQCCDHILEIERGELRLFTGSYHAYEEQKQEAYYRQLKAHEEQQKEIARKQETIQRFRAKPSKARMAQNMQKQLDRLERIPKPLAPPKTVAVPTKISRRLPRIVVKANDLCHAYGATRLFSNVSFSVERGDKMALVAPNGVGKTTLLKIIAGELKPTSGNVNFGPTVDWAYFKQDHHEALNDKHTIWQAVEAAGTRQTDAEARSLLGSFLFSGDDIHKKVSVLSGGEKNRLRMVITLLQEHNFLLLDEPTNHLDIPSKDVLKRALVAYEGSLLFVTHDIDFIDTVATHVAELSPSGLSVYHGSYRDYCNQKEEEPTTTTSVQQSQNSSPQQKKTAGRSASKEEKQKLRSLEKQVEKYERKKRELTQKLEAASYGTKEFDRLTRELETCQTQLQETEEAWEKLSYRVLAASDQ